MQAQLAGLLRPLIDQELSVVFDDRPAMGVEGPSELEGDVRQVGLSKDGDIRRQFLRGVVQTAEGWPLPHRVWEGNTAEAPALSSVVDEVLSPYPLKRVVLVADRGRLRWETIGKGCHRRASAQALSPWSSSWAVPGRRDAERAAILEPIHAQRCADARREGIGQTSWQGLRRVWAPEPQRAPQQTQARRQRLAALTQEAEQRAGSTAAHPVPPGSPRRSTSRRRLFAP